MNYYLYKKNVKNMLPGRTIFSTQGAKTTGFPQKNEAGPLPHTVSIWTKDLNIRAKTRILRKNIGVNLCDTELCNGFLDMVSKAKMMKNT